MSLKGQTRRCNTRSLLSSVGIVLLAAFLVPVDAEAQVLYGSIVGSVSDQTGAAIPGADVTIVNQETNFTRQVITDDVGCTALPRYNPGPAR